ncbi:MAG TPA: hypothetical protein VMU87_05490 [Stellaceae bacterium]|nr:hypothetical protein [Stellaceae bacterium]
MPAAVERTPLRRPRQREETPPPAAASVLFKHPSGQRTKRVKPGFAWDLFLFAGLFGIPLFLRGLPGWGAAVLALWIADLFLGWVGPGALFGPGQFALFAAFLGLQCWLGVNGNAVTARACRARGWVADNARDAGVKRALRSWRIEAE